MSSSVKPKTGQYLMVLGLWLVFLAGCDLVTGTVGKRTPENVIRLSAPQQAFYGEVVPIEVEFEPSDCCNCSERTVSISVDRAKQQVVVDSFRAVYSSSFVRCPQTKGEPETVMLSFIPHGVGTFSISARDRTVKTEVSLKADIGYPDLVASAPAH